MSLRFPVAAVFVALAACNIDDPFAVAPKNCDPRTAYYPDDDGNGLGEPRAVYLGCEAPDGWVAELDPEADDTADSGDTGAE